MGLFHCPMGSVYYEDEPCIDCRLCLASTEEEVVLAKRKIRDYLRTNAKTRKGPSQKIAVCGKGGTGKSTIVALMANAFLDLGYFVLVIDMDESNSGLHQMLGFRVEAKPLVDVLGRFPMGEIKSNAEWFDREKILLEDIPAEYLLGGDNLRFLMAGKITEPFQGCACSMADLIRDFVRKLVLKDKEVVIIDTEAGIESFGRGVERGVDTVIIAAEPSSESLALAEKISYMAEGIGVSKVRAIPNKVPSERVENKIIEEVEKRKIKVIGVIYLDGQISEASLEGKEPPGNSNAQKTIKEVVRRLLNESQ